MPTNGNAWSGSKGRKPSTTSTFLPRRGCRADSIARPKAAKDTYRSEPPRSARVEWAWFHKLGPNPQRGGLGGPVSHPHGRLLYISCQQHHVGLRHRHSTRTQLITFSNCCEALPVRGEHSGSTPLLVVHLKFGFPITPVHIWPVAIPTPVFLPNRFFEAKMIMSATRIAWRLLYS